MENEKKIEVLRSFNQLPSYIRTAVCAGYALGKLEAETNSNNNK